MSFLIGIILGVAGMAFQAELPDCQFCLLFFGVAVLLFLLSFSRFFNHLPVILSRSVRLISGFCLGIAVAAFVLRQGSGVVLSKNLEGRQITVTGVVSTLPHAIGKGSNFEFSVERAESDGVSVDVPEKILLSTRDTTTSIHVGQRWRFEVRLKCPHGTLNPYGFDFERWLFERHLGATGFVSGENNRNGAVLLDDFVLSPMNLVHMVRSGIREKIARAIPDSSAAGVVIALVIGDQRSLSQHDWSVFSKAGISHLIAISGLHIALVAGMVAWLVGFFWRRSFFMKWQLPLVLPVQKVSILAGIIAAVLYVLLSGMGIPARRVLIMIVIAAISLWSGRLLQVYRILLLSAAVILLVEPLAVLKPGFWLSFIAVAFILYVSARGTADEVLSSPCLRRCLSAVFAFCRIQFAITVGLSAVTLFFWGRVSVVGPFVNALAIPLFSFLVTPFALIGSILPSPVADFILWVVSVILENFCFGLNWISHLDFAEWVIPVPSVWLFFFALIGAWWFLAPKGWGVRLLGVGCFLPFLFLKSASPDYGDFRALVLDVGQGGGILVETAGHRMLFDTGPTVGDSDMGERVIAPYLRARGIDQLDLITVSHGDSDHSGGLNSLIKGLPVGAILTSMDSSSVELPVRLCVVGQSWEWDGVRFDVLYPDKSDYFNKNRNNDLSCVIKVTDENHSLLLTGDIEHKTEADLTRVYGKRLKSDVLIAPHHGSATSSSWPFLLAVKPKYSIFQVGYRNTYHHPHIQTINRYALAGVQFFRSDLDGAVLVDSSISGISVQGIRSRQRRFWHFDNLKK